VRNKALLRRAKAREGLGDLEGCVEDFKEVLKGDPKHKEACAKLRGVEAKYAAVLARKKQKKESGAASAAAGGGTGAVAGVNSPSDLFTREVEKARKAVEKDKAEAASRPPKPPLIVETSSSSSSSLPSSASPLLLPPVASKAKAADNKAKAASPPPLSPSPSSPLSPSLSSPSAPENKKKATATSSPTPSPVKVMRVKAQVPSEAPKTMYELERVWRELKASDADLAAYLKLFKVATFKKVFKESTSPDIVPMLLRVAATQLAVSTVSTATAAAASSAPSPTSPCLSASASPSKKARDLGACSRVLRGLAATAGFPMTRMLLNANDKACVATACEVLAKSAKYAADAAEIRAAYQVS